MPYLVTAFPIFSLKLRLGIKRLWGLFLGCFSENKVNSSLNMTSLTTGALNKDIKSVFNIKMFCEHKLIEKVKKVKTTIAIKVWLNGNYTFPFIF